MPSIIHVEKERRTSACCVFEGSMDFLSYQSLKNQNDDKIVQQFPCDSIVLNSTSLIKRAIPFISVYECAFCYLDNDPSGEKAFSLVGSLTPVVLSQMSGSFLGFNDLNDYTMSKMQRGLSSIHHSLQ